MLLGGPEDLAFLEVLVDRQFLGFLAFPERLHQLNPGGLVLPDFLEDLADPVHLLLLNLEGLEPLEPPGFLGFLGYLEDLERPGFLGFLVRPEPPELLDFLEDPEGLERLVDPAVLLECT